MSGRKIVWKDLPKRRGLFTRRSGAMISLDNGTTIQYYSANTKINVIQETIVDGVKYFRTESAANKGLNWAFKASAFDLPKDELASLAPSKESFSAESSDSPTQNSPKINTRPKEQRPSKSEEKVSEDRKKSIMQAFKRFFRKAK